MPTVEELLQVRVKLSQTSQLVPDDVSLMPMVRVPPMTLTVTDRRAY